MIYHGEGRNNMIKRMIPGKDGNKYVPYNERSGEELLSSLRVILAKKALRRFTTR